MNTALWGLGLAFGYVQPKKTQPEMSLNECDGLSLAEGVITRLIPTATVAAIFAADAFAKIRFF
ncbi:MAG: hypothetical protein ACJASV_002397 [Pseudorhodobacter sp.]|jgi:hypothetical protein